MKIVRNQNDSTAVNIPGAMILAGFLKSDSASKIIHQQVQWYLARMGSTNKTEGMLFLLMSLTHHCCSTWQATTMHHCLQWQWYHHPPQGGPIWHCQDGSPCTRPSQSSEKRKCCWLHCWWLRSSPTSWHPNGNSWLLSWWHGPATTILYILMLQMSRLLVLLKLKNTSALTFSDTSGGGWGFMGGEERVE